MPIFGCCGNSNQVENIIAGKAEPFIKHCVNGTLNEKFLLSIDQKDLFTFIMHDNYKAIRKAVAEKKNEPLKLLFKTLKTANRIDLIKKAVLVIDKEFDLLTLPYLISTDGMLQATKLFKNDTEIVEVKAKFKNLNKAIARLQSISAYGADTGENTGRQQLAGPAQTQKELMDYINALNPNSFLSNTGSVDAKSAAM